MQRILKYILCCFMTFTLLSGRECLVAQQGLDSDQEYVRETKTLKYHLKEQSVDIDLEYGPIEIKYGDVLYINWVERNESDKIAVLTGSRQHDRRLRLVVNNVNFTKKGYSYSPEINDTIYAPKNPTPEDIKQKKGKEIEPKVNSVTMVDSVTGGSVENDIEKYYLRPGGIFEHRPLAIEFPPLEDWNAPFWTELREKMTPEGVTCKMEMTFYDRNFSFPVVIKPRDPSELELLEQWLESTPSELYPKKSKWWNRKLTWETFLDDRSVELSPVTINNEKYPSYLFMRFGNRKPGVPNIPKTIDEWKQLEERLQPSSLRDEITFTRMQLEYYDSDNEEAKEAKLNSIASWIESLPAPQAAVYTDLIMERFKRSFPAAAGIQKDIRNLAARIAPLQVAKYERPNDFSVDNIQRLQKEYNRQEASEKNLKRYRDLIVAIDMIDFALKENQWLTDKQRESLQESRKVLEQERDNIERIDPTTINHTFLSM